jgi:hypothetical protein
MKHCTIFERDGDETVGQACHASRITVTPDLAAQVKRWFYISIQSKSITGVFILSFRFNG